jgi:SAM-dependent methyltransferase
MPAGLDRIAEFYSKKLRQHGARPAGVSWSSPEAQELRFTQLLRLVGSDRAASINDYGCGYGALAARLRRDGYTGDYVGYDVSREMVRVAADLHKDLPRCRFTMIQSELPRADYTLASGIFHIRLDFPVEAWERHVRETTEHLAEVSSKGFAFNLLSAGGDNAHSEGLFYADPARWLTFGLRRFPRRVALLHDYALGEFTVVVRSKPISA